MTDEELAEIEQRAMAASDGPWEYDYKGEAVVERSSGGDEWICQTWSKQEEAFENQDTNGEFIAHARTDIPKLLKEIRRLRG